MRGERNPRPRLPNADLGGISRARAVAGMRSPRCLPTASNFPRPRGCRDEIAALLAHGVEFPAPARLQGQDPLPDFHVVNFARARALARGRLTLNSMRLSLRRRSS